MSKYAALTALCLAVVPAQAGELAALQGETVELGGFHGVVYFTKEEDGFRVVTTIAEGESSLPMRFVATLADNQVVTISVPGKLGELSEALELSRVGSRLTVDKVELLGPEVVSARPQGPQNGRRAESER